MMRCTKHGFKNCFAILEGPRFTICVYAAMAAMDAKLGYSCAKWRSFSAAIAFFLSQCCSFGFLDN